ncbi:hypothetical protein ACFOY8_11415 [Thalassospira xianhensis]|uniref:Uncharacterized protein n=1 Tax=Thalassospira xianhensis MCCC 1A02616 TaxID=1177929 RepID=A0A367UDC0_9PROT|nr:hypothetical protein [Thalassospira xianhensis]RCK05294.1 hypothetical protein TH5_14745 [Thalassospira xianhensis MCCC 1A02616]
MNRFFGYVQKSCAVIPAMTFVFVLMWAQQGHAQFNNKPYSFNTPTGSPGMSTAGRQAMLNDQLFDIRPRNMLRAENGDLLSIEKSKGGSAIVTDSSGNILPGYRGIRVFDVNVYAGAFNSYFTLNGADGRVSYGGYNNDTITGWINLVDQQNGPMIPYYTSSPIDAWTMMVARN